MGTSKKKPQSTRWYNGDTPFEELDPGEQVAHTIVLEFGDLAPSVERIMSSDLTTPQRNHAIGLFQASLGVLDDPHRNPHRAIDTARTAVD